MGGIIAVSYEARAKGVTRQMSGHEAKKAPQGLVNVLVWGFVFASLKQVFVGNIPNSEKLGYPHHFQVFAGDIIVQLGYLPTPVYRNTMIISCSTIFHA